VILLSHSMIKLSWKESKWCYCGRCRSKPHASIHS